MSVVSGPGLHLPLSAYPELFWSLPAALLVLGATDLVIREANEAYLAETGLAVDQLVGREFFSVFPDSPLREGVDQSGQLRSMLRQVAETGRGESCRGLRYDTAGVDGFHERWWNVTDVPVTGPDGAVAVLVHHIEEVTDLVHARDELLASERVKEAADRRIASLAEVAMSLTVAETLADLEEIVVRRGTRVLGADGGSVVSRADDGGWRITVDPALGEDVLQHFRHVPHDSLLPGAEVARTGRRILLPTRAAGLAHTPVMADVYRLRKRDGWAFLPMVVQGEVIGSLAISWAQEHVCTPEELDVLEAFAAQCAATLHRIEASEARWRDARRVQELAEALQRAMLTPPPQPDSLEIAVRYRSAIDLAQVGGDWYDAFQQPDGATMVAIGDVCGHDDAAAGTMGQLRGLLRALAYDGPDRDRVDTPATVLTRFEYVARGLSVEALATAVLARIEPVGADGDPRRVVRWSNAGNPPPVLIDRHGGTRLLDPQPDLLLGVDPTVERHDHVVELPDGATLLLYTDGLIERRGTSIDEGLADLRRTVADLAGESLDELCDTVLARLAPHTGEDDIAMLAVRAARRESVTR